MLIVRSKSDHLVAIEKAYLQVRAKENRLYSDEVVEALPNVNKHHVHYKEWLIRNDSLKTILTYLKAKPRRERVLDLACGNGWMSNRLQQNGFEVVGVDINRLELEQAARLFPRVQFYELNIVEDTQILGRFDAIVISAALQYFEDPLSLIHKLKTELLTENGVIIIADTKFYTGAERIQAQRRSQYYYQGLGEAQMSPFYFHHDTQLISQWNATLIQNKSIFDQLAFRIKGVQNPFSVYALANEKKGNVLK